MFGAIPGWFQASLKLIAGPVKSRLVKASSWPILHNAEVDVASMKDLDTGWAFLVNVSDEFEMNIVCSLLETHDISVYIRHRDEGLSLGVILGVVKHSIDLFVPKDKLVESREILETFKKEPNDGL
ncbi:MAG TPA: hypothetical protein VFD15_01735 [Clostridia bacterium]|nr:hypothetical protein [Clostridia bacterium]